MMDALVAGRDSSGSSDLRHKGSARLVHFDGLRGWAALSVVIFHSTWELFGGAFPWLQARRVLLNDGPLAVFVFFVLSGFVLSRQHIEVTNLARLRGNAAGRYVRLTIPIVAASLLAFILLASGAMFNHQAAGIISRADWLDAIYTFRASLWECLRFAFFDVYFRRIQAPSYDPVLWTMQFELIGSFVVFAMVALFALGPWVRLLSCVGAMLLFWNDNPWYLCFVFGYLLANLHALGGEKIIVHGAAANAAGIILFTVAAWYRLDHDGLRTNAILGGLLVLAPMLSSFLRRLLSCALSTWLGRISFPLYLVHIPIICSLSSFLIVKLHELSWSQDQIAILVVPVTIAASLGAAHLLEPVERLAIRSSHRVAALALGNGGTIRNPG